jgi:hypothetical protein
MAVCLFVQARCLLLAASSTGRRNTHYPEAERRSVWRYVEVFSSFTAAEKPVTLGSLAVCATPWHSNLSRKNEIECCVDRLNPPPKADIGECTAHVRS